MRLHKGYLLALAGFVILVGSLVLSTPFSGHGESKAKPKPTRRAPAETAWTADPAPLPPAEEVDLLDLPPAVRTVQETGPIVFKEGELEAYLTFPVPVGTRMVIDTVSVRAQISPGQKAQVMFSATAGQGTATFAVPLAYQGRFERQGDSFAGLERLRAYADGGSVVTFRIDRTAVGELDSGFISISGILESR